MVREPNMCLPTLNECILKTDTWLGVVPSSTLGWQEQPEMQRTRAVPMPEYERRCDSSSVVRRGRRPGLARVSTASSTQAPVPAGRHGQVL
jgi:hypothetical protein